MRRRLRKRSLMSEWPPDYKKEYMKRTRLLNACAQDKQLCRALLKHYANNPQDWITEWAITYDPRVVKPRLTTMPFVLFERQIEFVQFLNSCVMEKECGLIEKSRDVGATWICCAYSVWLWLFVPGASIGWGSRKELLVDRIGDPDSIGFFRISWPRRWEMIKLVKFFLRLLAPMTCDWVMHIQQAPRLAKL